MKNMTTEQLMKRMETGPLALFDVRGDVEYEQGHLPGARTAPLGSLVFRVASLMKPDSEVIVYSGGGDCTLATQAAQRLEGLGLRNIYCYEVGMQGWHEAGHIAIPSPSARVHTHGPARDCRPLIVDRERAYGGAFKNSTLNVEGAGG
jgi:rhodanese-related sulfurtransferase